MTDDPVNGTAADGRPPAGRDPAGRLQPLIEVAFDRPDRSYAARDPLTVRYRVLGPGNVLRAIEQSVVWYTEGKGEEDLGVHHFTRVTDRKALPAAGDEVTFATTLPASPLSYEGVIVKIRWCVRIRAFFPGGRDFVSEHVFEVGHVPPAQPPRTPGRVETTA
jgi:hypothetical protein